MGKRTHYDKNGVKTGYSSTVEDEAEEAGGMIIAIGVLCLVLFVVGSLITKSIGDLGTYLSTNWDSIGFPYIYALEYYYYAVYWPFLIFFGVPYFLVIWAFNISFTSYPNLDFLIRIFLIFFLCFFCYLYFNRKKSNKSKNFNTGRLKIIFIFFSVYIFAPAILCAIWFLSISFLDWIFHTA